MTERVLLPLALLDDEREEFDSLNGNNLLQFERDETYFDCYLPAVKLQYLPVRERLLGAHSMMERGHSIQVH